METYCTITALKDLQDLVGAASCPSVQIQLMEGWITCVYQWSNNNLLDHSKSKTCEAAISVMDYPDSLKDLAVHHDDLMTMLKLGANDEKG